MDENQVDEKAEELFEPFEEYAYELSLDDALSMAEALEIRFSNYADAIRDDLRNRI
jgi:hypothetical protein